MLKQLINICILIFSLSFSLNAQINFSEFKALEGLWKVENDEEETFEEWKYLSDSLLLGKSFTINKNDTIINEYLKIKAVENTCYYSAKVLNQNNAEEISFKLISSENNIYVFENKKHDFPKRIIYNLSQKNKITASIENEKKKFKIKMQKINK